MRPDGKVAVMIGERIGAVCAESAAAIAPTGHDIVVRLSGFPQ